MASMGFDQATLSLIMNIAEDRMETDLSESEYLKICNALKALNQIIPRPQAQTVSREQANFHQLNVTLENLRRHGDYLETARLNNVHSTPRVTMACKQQVIEELLPHTVARGPRGAVIKMNKRCIDTYEIALIGSGFVANRQAFHERCRVKALAKHEENLNSIGRSIERNRNQIDSHERRIAEFLRQQEINLVR